MKVTERQKDLIICIFGFLLASVSFITFNKISFLSEIHHKSGVYAGTLFFLIYTMRLKIAAEGNDPESNQAFKEYIKLGSFILVILILAELPLMISTL